MLLGNGAIGEIVRRIQQKLGFVGTEADGWYGVDTQNAVVSFQQAHGLPASGEVDTSTWAQMMGQPVPTVGDRSLQLTAQFEGHGFALAQGNFDGAGITWGIVGFTLSAGEIARMVLEIADKDP